MFIISNNKKAPEGFRNLSDDEIAKDFLSLDIDKNFVISKNEWIINFVKLYEKDIESLEKEGPDAILKKIQELSDEFDRYDKDENKQIDFSEYKEFLENNLFISI